MQTQAHARWTAILPEIDREAVAIGLEPVEIRTLLLLRSSGLIWRLLGPETLIDIMLVQGLSPHKDALYEQLSMAEHTLADILPAGYLTGPALEIVERHLVDPVTRVSGIDPRDLFVPLARAAGECFIEVSSAADSPLDTAQVVMIGCRPLVGQNPIPMLVQGREYRFAGGLTYRDGQISQE